MNEVDKLVSSLTTTLVGAAAQGSNLWSSVLLIVLFVAIFYFFIMRPNRKQQDQRKEMMSGLHVGDRVVTIGGMHGVIDSLDSANKTVTIDADGIYLVFDLQAIHHVETPKSTSTAKVTDAATSSVSASTSEATSATSEATSSVAQSADSVASQATEKDSE
ncbi:Preprotein translocase subunit YajC [Furfurilactobacillus rossiae]|uniref:Preprotein translocase subunit YajC n=1 Tax=Furfurilactobacillus rossiae DSM 15814 TaxID=1114972 RepID=A0A0R1RIS1_9LACO|nr:hypothetical protein FD35_GL000568 [Furfurilactobacillus rossiae DSM 15814]QFR66319.1 preprotein translocase subunit YajC [Furfurilactobacillus rossiae]QLE61771.1 Preprotein translocase subunit YajC [Furfurilactobacillus rossiae]QLE64571.1 Preprotein translocase subunit YajC [Furfurilactobacillus rossiae]